MKAVIGTASGIVDKAQQTSSIFNSLAEDRIPVFETQELSLGHVVGRGGFCVVRELNGLLLDRASVVHGASSVGGGDKDDCISELDGSAGGYEEDILSREDLAKRVTRSNKARRKRQSSSSSSRVKIGRYVVKQLSDEIKVAKDVNLLKGITDLWIESKFLASLNHPNILKLRGMSFSPSVSKDDGMFIIIDCLKETFSTKLKTWMHKDRRTKGVTGFFTGGKKKVNRLLEDRLQAAYDVADAMSYLHSKKIVFRDLKPDNIGFDYDGNLKLFDFGLAKELPTELEGADGLYRLTAFTGAIRYMAPEVGLGKRYNLKADVYSWSILMWYIMALEPPFAYFTHDMFTHRVFQRGTRPAIRPEWSPNITTLLKNCWSSKIPERPDFHEIKDVLRVQICTKDDSSQYTFWSDNVASENAAQTRQANKDVGNSSSSV